MLFQTVHKILFQILQASLILAAALPARHQNLIGIRGRYLDEEDVENIGKYVPLNIEGKFLSHKLSHNLYGIHINQNKIKTCRKCLLLESEKGVMQNHSYFGDDDFSLAVCGSEISDEQIKLLLDYLKIEELILGFDKEYKDPYGWDGELYKNKLFKKIRPIIPYCKVSILWDKDLTFATSTNSLKPTTTQGSDTMNKDKAIDALIACAENEVGYLEKKSNSQLDDKTANAGYNNYTKYWRDVYPQYQAQAWCAAFVSWCMMKTFGLDVAKKLLKHWPYVYCPTLGNLFTKYANPQRGDIVIFYRNGTFAHTGLVTKVEGDKFYTIEGNTSGGSSIVPNGGGVYAKSYYNSNLPGTKFCRPDYSIVTSILTSNTSSTSSPAPVQPSYTAWVGSCTANGTDVFSGATGASKLSTYPKLNAGNLVDIIGESGTRYQVRIAAKYIGYVEKSNIKNPNTPAVTTTKKYPFVGKVTASKLNVRKKPGTEHPLLPEYPMLNKDNLINVLGVTKDTKGDRWYKVSITKKEYVGYVSAKYIIKA